MRTLNDYWEAERRNNPIRLTKDELKAEQIRLKAFNKFYFNIDGPKCCECYPIFKKTNGYHIQKSYCECIVCGKKTDPVDDYSWQETKRRWKNLFEKENLSK